MRYLGQPTTAIGDRFGQLFPAASAHAGALLVLIGLLLALSRAWPAGRRVIAMAACVVFALLMIAGQADLTVATITGAPLTPTLFRTFRGIHVVTSNEFLEPLKANAALAGGGLVLFLALVAWMTRLIRQDWKDGAQTSWPEATATIVAGAALLSLPATITWPGPPPPIEVAFTREWLGLDRTSLRGSESDAVRELRADSRTSGARDLAERRIPARVSRMARSGFLDAAPKLDSVSPSEGGPPDIVVVMIESLRADALGASGGRPSVTPNLDALARRSVVFPTFTSNGFPSAPSVPRISLLRVAPPAQGDHHRLLRPALREPAVAAARFRLRHDLHRRGSAFRSPGSLAARLVLDGHRSRRQRRGADRSQHPGARDRRNPAPRRRGAGHAAVRVHLHLQHALSVPPAGRCGRAARADE